MVARGSGVSGSAHDQPAWRDEDDEDIRSEVTSYHTLTQPLTLTQCGHDGQDAPEAVATNGRRQHCVWRHIRKKIETQVSSLLVLMCHTVTFFPLFFSTSDFSSWVETLSGLLGGEEEGDERRVAEAVIVMILMMKRVIYCRRLVSRNIMYMLSQHTYTHIHVPRATKVKVCFSSSSVSLGPEEDERCEQNQESAGCSEISRVPPDS